MTKPFFSFKNKTRQMQKHWQVTHTVLIAVLGRHRLVIFRVLFDLSCAINVNIWIYLAEHSVTKIISKENLTFCARYLFSCPILCNDILA